MRSDFPRLNDSLTVEMALRVIRQKGVGERIVYFYVLDDEDQLPVKLNNNRVRQHPDGRFQARVPAVPAEKTFVILTLSLIMRLIDWNAGVPACNGGSSGVMFDGTSEVE
jgi:hypothetical protein